MLGQATLSTTRATHLSCAYELATFEDNDLADFPFINKNLENYVDIHTMWVLSTGLGVKDALRAGVTKLVDA